MKQSKLKDLEWEFLAEESFSPLNFQQKVLYNQFWCGFVSYLRDRGKKPNRYIGYSQSSVRPIARRVHQVFDHYWKEDRIVLNLDQDHANRFLKKLDKAEITNSKGNEYVEGSKRKFTNALTNYFEFVGQDWIPEISFGTEEPTFDSDPFNSRERELLLDAALGYKSPPTYSNASPEERTRWNAQIAQYLGKPKADVSPSDWDELQRSWKVPSIISTTLDAGWRAVLVGRLNHSLLDLENSQIIIPGEIAAKNNAKWEVTLSETSVRILRKWKKERANKVKYDNSDALWLNRERNRYSSGNLNDLLRNLMDEAGIEAENRTLTWHSIRHSTGMYVYNQERDLSLVAEILRHKSLESARKYAHPTPETKRNIVENLHGGI